MRPKKSYGQHFLTAPSFARRIAEAVPATAQDYVLEIGPGQGALSVFLEERFPSFHCVELDTDVIDILKSKKRRPVSMPPFCFFPLKKTERSYSNSTINVFFGTRSPSFT